MDSPIGKPKAIIDHFEEIELAKPSDNIIQQIRRLITSGILSPGDRLPSERALERQFGVGRGHIREAIKKLEFYGILETYPARGTYVTELNVKTLDTLISNIMQFEPDDALSLVAVRSVLEVYAAQIAAELATEEDIRNLRALLDEFRNLSAATDVRPRQQIDVRFHLAIAQISRNKVLSAFIGLLATDLIKLRVPDAGLADEQFPSVVREHDEIVQGISSHDSDRARSAMNRHMELYLEKEKRALEMAGEGEHGSGKGVAR